MLKVATLCDHDEVRLICLDGSLPRRSDRRSRAGTRESSSPEADRPGASAASLNRNPKWFHGWLLFVQVVSHRLQSATVLNSDCYLPRSIQRYRMVVKVFPVQVVIGTAGWADRPLTTATGLMSHLPSSSSKVSSSPGLTPNCVCTETGNLDSSGIVE